MYSLLNNFNVRESFSLGDNDDNDLNYILIYKEDNITGCRYYSLPLDKKDLTFYSNEKNLKKFIKEKIQITGKKVFGKKVKIYKDNNLLFKFSNKSNKSNFKYNDEYWFYIRTKNDSSSNNYLFKTEITIKTLINGEEEQFKFKNNKPIFSKKKYILGYKLIPSYLGISSVKNFSINNEDERILEFMRFPNNIFIIAYKKPFTYMHCFMIGISRFSIK